MKMILIYQTIWKQVIIENLKCSSKADNISHQYTFSFDMGIAAVEIIKLGNPSLLAFPPPPPPSCNPAGLGYVNAQPLTPNGKILLEELMKRGMLIDIDHMSQDTQKAALKVAKSHPRGGYPMNSGHSLMREMTGPGADERSPSPEIYLRIAALHGMAGIGTGTLNAWDWEKAASRVIDVMATNIPARQAALGDLAVGLGTDTNGLWMGMPPRSGSKIAYNASFPRSSLGSKTWDYNTDGVAHYGLLPEFILDAEAAPGDNFRNRNAGSIIIPTYFKNGAEYFYNTWLKSVELTDNSPLNVAPVLTLVSNSPSLFPPMLSSSRALVQPGQSFSITGSSFHPNLLFNSVDLNWKDSTSAKLTHFEIEGVPSSDEAELASVREARTSFTVSNLVPNTSYVFKVRDCDDVLCTLWSNPVSFTNGSAQLTSVDLTLDEENSASPWTPSLELFRGRSSSRPKRSNTIDTDPNRVDGSAGSLQSQRKQWRGDPGDVADHCRGPEPIHATSPNLGPKHECSINQCARAGGRTSRSPGRGFPGRNCGDNIGYGCRLQACINRRGWLADNL